MASGAGNFERTFRGLLPADVFEVDREMLRFVEQGLLVDRRGQNPIAGVHKMNYIQQRLDWIYGHTRNHGGFPGIQLWDNNAGNLASTGLDGDRKGASDAANAAIQRQLANKQTIADF